MDRLTIILIVLAIVLLVAILYVVASFVVAYKATMLTLMRTPDTAKKRASSIRFNEHKLSLETAEAKKVFDEAREKFYNIEPDGLLTQKVTLPMYEITADDGVKLSAQIIQNGSESLIVAVHGHLSSGSDILCEVYPFIKKGYDVFLPDLRAHGKSGGEYCGMGVLECNDLILWLKLIKQEFSYKNIILFGISMGASTVVAASDLGIEKYAVKGIISDCAFSSAYAEFRYQFVKNRRPTFPALAFCNLVAKHKFKFSLKDNSPIAAVKNCKVPILFIHGKNDKYVPCSFAQNLYDAANCGKKILFIDNAAHAVSMQAGYCEYFAAIDYFLAL